MNHPEVTQQAVVSQNVDQLSVDRWLIVGQPSSSFRQVVLN